MGDHACESMVVDEDPRANDLPVNPTKEKQLTNMRASGSDENIQLEPPRLFSLEAALEYVQDDEWVEVTPSQIRVRKQVLKENERKRVQRAAKA